MQKLFLLLIAVIFSQELFIGNWNQLNPTQFEQSKEYQEIKTEIYSFLQDKNLIESKHLTKLKILEVSTQVVAGLNYKFLLVVSNKKTEKHFLFYTIVWKKINDTKQFELMEYEIIQNFSNFEPDKQFQENKKFKQYLEKFHYTLHQGKITFHLRSFYYILKEKENNKQIVIANYVLEGTNNEISQFEHIISVSMDGAAFATLAMQKLKVGYFLGENQTIIEEKLNVEQETCTEIQSYYKCQLKNKCKAEIDGCKKIA